MSYMNTVHPFGSFPPASGNGNPGMNSGPCGPFRPNGNLAMNNGPCGPFPPNGNPAMNNGPCGPFPPNGNPAMNNGPCGPFPPNGNPAMNNGPCGPFPPNGNPAMNNGPCGPFPPNGNPGMNNGPRGPFPPNGNPGVNNGPCGPFPPPSGSPRMVNCQNRYPGPPRFNSSCPWRPAPERQNFNINRFMQPPHVQRPDFVPQQFFGQEVSNGPHENFPFNRPQNSYNIQNNIRPQNNYNAPNNGQHFHGPSSRGSGFGRGHHGDHGFRGGFNNDHHHQRSEPSRFNAADTTLLHSSPPFNNNKQRNNADKTKKQEKVNKRDLPENNAFFCDICDRGFKTADKYQEHVDGHIKCTFKDCPFIAAPKLVQLHMNMQHRTGLAKKVWNMESEEDVNKWRDDRKRNYPTSDNMARKKQEREEKMSRGEILETKEFGKMRGRRGRNRHKGRARGRGRGHRRDYDQFEGNESEPVPQDDSEDDSPPEEVAIKKFPGIEHPGFEKEVAVIKGEAHITKNGDLQVTSQKDSVLDVSEASLSLLSSYGESSSDCEMSEGESGTTAEQPTEELQNPSASISPSVFSTVLQHQASTNGIQSAQNGSNKSLTSSVIINGVHYTPTAPSDVQSNNTTSSITSTIHTDSEGIRQSSDIKSQENQKKTDDKAESRNDDVSKRNKDGKEAAGSKRGMGSDQQGGPLAKKKKKEFMKQQTWKYTLLEKLLAPDIRRERNKVLQCVHYIVKHNLFESGLADKHVLLGATVASKRAVLQDDKVVVEVDKVDVDVDKVATQVDKEATQVDKEATQVDKVDAEVNIDSAQVDREATQVDRVATQVDKEATQVDKVDAEVNIDSAQVDREATQVDIVATQVGKEATQVDKVAAEVNIDSVQADRKAAQVDIDVAQVDIVAIQIDKVATQVDGVVAEVDRDCAHIYRDAAQVDRDYAQVDRVAAQVNKYVVQDELDDVQQTEHGIPPVQGDVQHVVQDVQHVVQDVQHVVQDVQQMEQGVIPAVENAVK